MAARKKAATKAKATAKKVTKVKKVASTASKSKALKVSDPFTKTQLIATLAERCGLSKKEVSLVLDELKEVMAAHLSKKGPGQFTIPGTVKLVVRKTPAKKARKGINPFTGEETVFKAKPASRKVKATVLKLVKEMALS